MSEDMKPDEMFEGLMSLILFVPILLWWGMVASVCWNLLVTLSGLPEINYLSGLGLRLAVLSVGGKTKSAKRSIYELAFLAIFYGSLAMGISWLAYAIAT